MSIQDSVAPASETKFSPRDLILAFDQFMKILDAATTPTGDGGCRVGGVSHAVALSEETSKLQSELLLALRMLIHSHGIPRKSGVQVPIGGTGAAADLAAVIEGALSVIAIPGDRWNLLQGKNPGSNHHRWQLGDIIEADLLGTLESSQKLLHVHADSQESLPQEEEPTTRRTGSKKRGRARVSEAEEQKRVALVKEWGEAKGRRSQTDFCGDKKIAVKYLKKCIDWYRTRMSRFGKIE